MCNQAGEARKRARTEYGELFDSVAALLFKHDPIGINFQTNTDEYEPEARTILPRLKDCHSVDDLQKIVHEEFVKWFGPADAGPSHHYRDIASEIWSIWLRTKHTQSGDIG